MTQQPPSERRRYVRLEQQHMLRHEKYVFEMTDEREIFEEGMVKNYSLGGVLFESKVKYNVGDTLKLAITIRGWERYKNEFYKDDEASSPRGASGRAEPVIVLGRAVRVQVVIPPLSQRLPPRSHRSPEGEEPLVEQVYDIAVEFIGLDEGDRWTLMKQIKAQLKEKDKS